MDPDPGHGCADPSRCTRDFCAAPVDICLVAPEDTRVVVGELADWPMSASALFDRLNDRITRQQLLRIAGTDPFGAHQHFPILVGIRLSGQVPAKLAFDPGEALRLTCWGSGPDVDHLARAWCCALVIIIPGNDGDDLYEVATRLTESCLALGGDLPRLAEQLLAWRAATEDHGYADPVALLALLLLRATTDPADARLIDLARTVTDTFAAPRQLPWPGRLRRELRRRLTPLRPIHPDLNRLADALSQDHGVR
ncbi:hypothetical protein AB0M36_11910 [Actinoplanes sp. NPDC051346]|uniref:hypothetical protein n=1 Tax=Actinoplanes sp. NPDC051346 TaxID=3155048 RepID=UPI003427A43E